LLEDEQCHRAVEAGENYADGLISHAGLRAASEAAFAERNDLARGSVAEAAAIAAAFAVVDDREADFASSVYSPAATAERSAQDIRILVEVAAHQPRPLSPAEVRRLHRTETTAQANLLRDVVGNSISLPRVDRARLKWNGGTVVAISQAIYDERAFDRMPILADALEDAGCDDAEILTHCREPGEHARGCWVIDLLLGKS
jgi:hypothetical protein